MCKHRDTSLTASRRYYHSRRSCFHQSTIRSRLQETTITMLTNGSNHNGCNNMVSGGNGAGVTGNFSNDDTIDVALTTDYCHQHQHSHQLM
ncbi:neuropeptide CCHamide-1 receptor isoform X2 [Lucilia cuprina]|uniref:neuropeptide CCHamide-1 receptor isoform X2 n=1 Tax=Lucilia cuprina TaxID=7375 RepID=UPI001F0700D9|nr:neuropeptide CCHamide-1 receptor isoform X2 [Lucilia cuprina]